MISASVDAKTNLSQSSVLMMEAGCLIEHNMNSMVDGITVSASPDYAVIGDQGKPFAKLFPVESIVRSSRPRCAGIRYAILPVASGTYGDPSSTQYGLDYRTYMPGANTAYKYWLAPLGQAVDVTVTYASQTIITNKIVVRFEISHSTPTSWTIYGNSAQLATGTTVVPFRTGGNKNYNAGEVIIYYTGSGWTTNPLLHDTSSSIAINTLRLTSPAIVGQYIGVIELSPRWVSDISQNIVSLSILKESSSQSDGILPVGDVSANSMQLSLNTFDYNGAVVPVDYPGRMISFKKGDVLSSSSIYLYKMSELRPFFKIYHNTGTLSDSKGSYENVYQGVFFCDTWTKDEFGEISLSSLDGAKVLQDMIAPDILCERYSLVAILRRLLDSVGATNYNFNVNPTDQSIISPNYWWTDDKKTVWSSIQELCVDAQMTAVFDENNILQFYSREFILNPSRAADWILRYDASGSDLPNIISFSESDLASVDDVQVTWHSVTTSNYQADAQPLWKSGVTYMAALSLEEDLLIGDSYAKFSPVVVNQYQSQKTLYEYSGFLVIDSEIIEYDAIQYEYTGSDGSKTQFLVQSDADILQVVGLGKAGSSYIQPTGWIRIKNRGSFNTQEKNHYVDVKAAVASWSSYDNVGWS